MRGTRWENAKSAAIALLIGILAARSITWRDTFCQIAGGYVVAQVMWVFLVAYDEIQRKRKSGRRGNA